MGFQFTASCEADHHVISPVVGDSYFQFTASCEADLELFHGDIPVSSFNSQPHARLTYYVSDKDKAWYLSIHSLMRG